MGRRPNFKRSILPIQIDGMVDKEQRLFCYLHTLIGISAAESYRIAFSSKASMNSCAALACRTLKDEHIQDYIFKLTKYHEEGALECNYKALKTEKYWRY